MERSTTASACFNNLLCIWDEMLPPLESTTSWHMIQTSRISKNLRCLWNSNEKLKSSLGWHPMPNSVLVPLFWKLRNLEGTVLALRTEALWNPLWQSLALGDCMECTWLSVKVSQRSDAPSSWEIAAEKSHQLWKGSPWTQNQSHLMKRGSGTVLVLFCYIIN